MKIFIVIFFVFNLISSLASAAPKKPIGLYRVISELCSDGSVYKLDAKIMTSSMEDGMEVSINFLKNGVIEGITEFKGEPLVSGRYKAKYEVNKEGELKYLDILSVDYPEESPMTKETMEEALTRVPKTKVSVNDRQLVLSYPGFSGHGRCTAPAFIINILEKVN